MVYRKHKRNITGAVLTLIVLVLLTTNSVLLYMNYSIGLKIYKTNRIIQTQIMMKPVINKETSINNEDVLSFNPYIPMDVPNTDTSFKSYMDFKTLTDKKSKQYTLQQQAITNNMGFRVIDGKYLVAMGTYYSEKCGEEFEVMFDTGKTIRVITGDIKQNKHTDSKNMMTKVNETKWNVLEFIVDTDILSKKAITLGDVSCLGLEGNIVSINKII